MSNAQILVSESDESEAGDFLVKRLPPWMPISSNTGNFKLLDVVGRAIDRLDGDITDVNNANSVKNAETISQLKKLAKLVETPPKTGESLEKYRARVISAFQTATTETTADDVLNNAATLLGTNAKQLEYKKVAHGTIELRVPGKTLSDAAITDSEFVTIMDRHSAAGFSIESTIEGTFTYLSESNYSGGSTYSSNDLSSDATIGHDGLDANGDPKDNGGTYAGLIT